MLNRALIGAVNLRTLAPTRVHACMPQGRMSQRMEMGVMPTFYGYNIDHYEMPPVSRYHEFLLEMKLKGELRL